MSLNAFTRKVGKKIGPIGGAFMLHPDTGTRGQELDLDFFGYYALGRGGVLGDVNGDVVAAALHFFSPAMVTPIWDGAKAKVSPADAAAHYAESCAIWGRSRLDDIGDLDTFNKLGERAVEAADARGLPLFAGWRAMPLPDDAPARAYHLIHVLRELRGGANGIGVRAVGLTAPEAVGVNSPGMFQLFGWSGDLPDAEALRGRIDQAEDITDEICSSAFAVLDEGEKETFAATIDAIEAKLAS
jgi:hypothetical protein